MSLSALAIRRPVTTAMFFIGSGLLGLVSLSRLSVELMPEVVFPQIFVVANQRTMSPEQVERDLLIPIEGAIGKLEGVVSIESNASQSRATVTISYEPATDMRFAELQVQRQMGRLHPTLPEQTTLVVQRFDISVLTSSVMELQVLGAGDLNWLRDFAEERIRPDLESVEGVVAATVLGGQRGAIEVIVDPQFLAAYALSMNEISGAINSVNVPRTYLGSVYDGNQHFPVSIRGQFTGLSQIRDVVLRPDGPLHVGDVAEIHYGLQEQTDLSRVNGLETVSVRIQQENEANLIDVAAQLESTIERLNAELEPEGVQILITMNQAELMNEALGTLQQAAVVGVVLGLMVLFLFLRNLRFVAILLVAIPASLLLTFNAMYAWDLSLNVLSLCGLALSMGMLADNGIVVMESIFKQFERGKGPIEAARDGTADVSRAIIAATATTVAVFLPVVFVQSDFQDILTDLALAITFPLAASLLVALTLVPMLGARTLSRTSLRPLGTGQLLEKYTVVLKASLRHRVRVSLAVGIALTVTLVISFFFMLQQEPAREQSSFTVYADLPAGATLEATDEIVRRIEEAIAELDGVEQFTSSIQEAQGSVTVTLVDLADRPEGVSIDGLKEELEQALRRIEGGVVSFDAPTGGGGVGGGGGGRGGVGGRSTGGFSLGAGPVAETAIIRGHDFSTLQMLSEDLTFRLEQIEEIDPNSISADVTRSAPEVQVIPDPMAMFDKRLQVNTVLGAIEQANPEGVRTASAFLEPDGTETPIEVRYIEDLEDPQLRVDDLRQLPILTPAGDLTPMEEVARVRTDEGRRTILRTDQSRRVIVTYRFTQEILDSQPQTDAARSLVRLVVQDMVMPSGYSVELEEAQVDNIYYWMMAIAAILVYMILASLFESFSSPVVIFCALPTAVIGSCWALILTGTGLTSEAGPMALLGFIVLLGIAVNNGIILIDAIATLRSRRGFRRERAVLTAGRSRVRPILMTSATTLLGVLPLSLEFGGDFEIWPPFAITVLGGLAVSMVSTLIFVPVAYMGIDQVKEWLKQIGWFGVLLATTAAAAVTYGVYVRYNSYFWAALVAAPAWFSFLTVVWSAIRLHHMRIAAREPREPVRTIGLSTLTKIYGAPGRFRMDWGRFERRIRYLIDEGIDPLDRQSVKDGLLWKLPLSLLIVFLHTYLADPIWVYLLALTTWGFVAHLVRDIALLSMHREAGDPLRLPRRFRLIARYALLALLLYYVQRRLGEPSVTIATGVVFMVMRLIRYLALRVGDGKVDLETMSGRTAWLRKRIYAGAAAVPILGVPKPEFPALTAVNLEIGRGMFGLLGPNGAGKTTMMRIICQVLEPTYGSVSINGVNVDQMESLQGLIGYLPQHFGLYEHMTGYEYLDYRALLEGFREPEERHERVTACLEQVHLSDRTNDPIGSYSGGMKQRIGIAQTLLHMPQIMVVDEPTAGLDPVERIRFRNLLARLSQERIVIFSTHIVEDVAGSCNRLAVLNDGRVLYSGTPGAMRDLARGRVWEVVLPEETFDEIERDMRIVTHLRTPAGIRARFLADEAPEGIGAEHVDPTLEDAYLYLLDEHRKATREEVAA